MIEQILPWALGLVLSLLGAFGIVGRFALDFIKSERANSAEITKAFIEQLKQAGAECTQERLRQSDLLEQMQNKMFETIGVITQSIKEHTDKSVDNYNQGAQILANQEKLLNKFEEFIEAFNQDMADRRERRRVING